MTRTVFFGSPAPAAESLRRLAASGLQIAAVYTRADRVAGRSRSAAPTPVKQAAEALGIPVRTPHSLRGADARAELAGLGAELFVVVAYGRLLPPPVLSMPGLGVVNVHPSLLPRYRGPSPVVTALLDGAPETGVTVMLLDEGMDTGPVLARSEPVRITPEDTGGALTGRLFAIGTDLLLATLPRWMAGQIVPEPQDDGAATVTRLIEKQDGALDFARGAEELERAVRAYDPWPGTFTRWNGRSLKILEAALVPGGAGRPGTVVVEGDRLVVATGCGGLAVSRLQLEGRRGVTAAEFRRGYPAIEGAVLGI